MEKQNLIVSERKLKRTEKPLKKAQLLLKLSKIFFGSSIAFLSLCIFMLSLKDSDKEFYGILSFLFTIATVEGAILVNDKKKALIRLTRIKKYYEEVRRNSIETLNDTAFSNVRKPQK